MTRIAVFADVQNIYYTTKDTFNRSFNYRSFYQYLAQRHEIVCANAYAIDSNNDSQRKFQKALRHIGFDVKLKPFIQRKDGSAKGDWDVGITIDIMETAPHIDEIILLSGDGDFALLLDAIKRKCQCRCIVYGVLNLTSHTLINSADEFVDIDKRLLI